MNEMKISVFGLGYVGCVNLGCLAQSGNNIIGVDTNKNKINLINAGKATIVEDKIDEIISKQLGLGRIRATSDYRSAVLDSSISIICVGTPSTEYGHLNLKYIYTVAEQIGEAIRFKESFHTIVIRSTVLPGTNEKISKIIEEVSLKRKESDFAVVSNPEFLREGSAVNDYYNPPYILIGSTSKRALDQLSILYKDIKVELIIEEIKIVEMIKYVNNSFHALKVTFANEIGNICKELNIDSYKLMNIFIKDKILNLSSYYLKPGFAYGGSCLPKDLEALKSIAHNHNLETPIINNISKSNELQIERALKMIIDYNVNEIGFLGLSFKAGTDDLRNSPSVRLIEILIGKGYNIKIYDESVNLANIVGRNKDFIEKHIKHLTNLMVDDIEELIDNSQLIVITNKDKKTKNIIKNINTKKIFDLAHIDIDLLSMDNYRGICW